MRSRARWGEVAGLGACLAVGVVAFLGSYAHGQGAGGSESADSALLAARS